MENLAIGVFGFSIALMVFLGVMCGIAYRQERRRLQALEMYIAKWKKELPRNGPTK